MLFFYSFRGIEKRIFKVEILLIMKKVTISYKIIQKFNDFILVLYIRKFWGAYWSIDRILVFKLEIAIS